MPDEERKPCKGDSDSYLRERGWRRIGQRRNQHGVTHYWDHPDHQPLEHGAFTKSSALDHQRTVEKDGICDCIKHAR